MLRLNFRRSYLLTAVLVAAFAFTAALAIAAGWSGALPPWACVSFAAALLFACAHYVRRHAWRRAPGAVISALIKADGSMELEASDATTVKARLEPGSFVHPWLTTIRYRPEDRRFTRTLLVMADSLPDEQFRELRVWLRWRPIQKREL